MMGSVLITVLELFTNYHTITCLWVCFNCLLTIILEYVYNQCN